MDSHNLRPWTETSGLMSRRDVLKVGGLAGLGTLGGIASAAPLTAPSPTGRARSGLLIFLAGGPSHLDTFDPKPDAQKEVRGPFRSIGTAVPGPRICEHLPRLARAVGRYTIVRSLGHGEGRHDEAVHLMLTGREAPGPKCREVHPHLGSALGSLGSGGTDLPAFVTLPDQIMPLAPIRGGQDARSLGPGFEPLPLRGHPN